ncbi:MAG: hypothetical protein A3D44_00935 [Candidatus Staskawiczbacteria bacterium RIFCSPHIGHO2_02_FULL_42_22]|uniref:Uncharacterized protein n=1 Tax=Candidatus Staskawiczbacteria bacterium RIFCSPHIGHO2_02_FULL_42_22 TaxID=1802207 RepID=A0A1G2I3K3_9BACT|nr:MAG: hypothetical protein A3D44_00935 [Candidatus Staskawiczbacteria bacterium RIFCSPHIGHO2_02_FULL_42_22]
MKKKAKINYLIKDMSTEMQEYIKNLPTESLNEYKNAEEIKRALTEGKKEYKKGKLLTKL